MSLRAQICMAVMILTVLTSFAQKSRPAVDSYKPVDTALLNILEWRNIGPFRGGRCAAVTGVQGKPGLYYFGSTGGGVWRSKNGGQTWQNISDKYFGGSIGAIEVAQSDHNVIYVGGGEKTVRGNVSYGYGMYRSEDAGETWQHIGLAESRHISRIRIHPDNPDIVYAAVLGDLFKDTKMRGIYKSVDGGKTWKQTLFVNERAGAVDLILDPNNPRIMYASTWRVQRKPYELTSGGDGSAIWKSKDSGETWENIRSAEGLPTGIWGISGIAVSPVNSQLVYAIIENEDGGVFKSTDGGRHWTKTNSDRNLRQRAWYYSRIYADPKSEDIVYVVNVNYHKSKDGGRTFTARNANHGDHHDLWIDPGDPQRMIIGDDGGAQVSFDGGEIWSTYHNQPTAQFYRVTTDNHFPYRIYAAQQDNSTVRIAHRTTGGGISEADWESTAGCECGHIAVDPVNPDIVYGGCYDGVIERFDHKTGLSRSVDVWPDLPMGHGAEGMRYRFQWNFPIFFSPHDPKMLYTASNHLHVTTNEGQDWKTISPDLTRNDSTKLGPSGGPITKDNTSVEYYCTIFAAAESPRVKGLIWTGSDDGLIHVTRDGGANWSNVTPAMLPAWIQINSLEPDPHVDGGCYIAATMYKWGDYKPYLYYTADYGKTWRKITEGIDETHFTRVVRADPKQPGLLFAGTESGMYFSVDNGSHWQSFQQNLPIVPITDLAIKQGDLIAATQGRSIWIMDELHQLRQAVNTPPKTFTVFQPDSIHRLSGSGGGNLMTGTNYAGGLHLYYYLPETLRKDDTLNITIIDSSLDTVTSYSTHHKEDNYKLKVKQGMNHFNWNMRYTPARRFDGMVLWAGSLAGPIAVPGSYTVHVTLQDSTVSKSFVIIKDPRSTATDVDYKAYSDFAMQVRDKLTEAHEAIIEIRDIRKQLLNYQSLIEDDTLKKSIARIDSLMTDIEEALYQTKNKSGQDPLNYPVRLTNKLAYLNTILGSGEYGPTSQAIAVRQEIESMINTELKKFAIIKQADIPALNAMIRQKSIDAIILKNHSQ